MKDITVIGIDIAKNYIQLHGANDKGKPMLKKRLPRDKFLPFMANLPICLVGMESCGGANYWAIELIKLGFTVKLMSPRKVKKFVEHNKNDAKDAEGCSIAATRADVPAVPVKTLIQQEIQAIHRARSYYVKQQTALMNMMRGLLLELGIVFPKGKAALIRNLRKLLDADNHQLSNNNKTLYLRLHEDLKQLIEQVEHFSGQLETLAEQDEYCKRINSLPGIGPISATAVIAKIGNGSEFHKGRDLSAYLGLVPKQRSSGETQRLGKISKNGDRYVRTLLIHGARSSVCAAMRKHKLTNLFIKNDVHSEWMRNLVERVGKNKACVAVANKNARMIVALLKNQTNFQAELAH